MMINFVGHWLQFKKKEETGKEIYSEFSKGMLSNVYNTESLKQTIGDAKESIVVLNKEIDDANQKISDVDSRLKKGQEYKDNLLNSKFSDIDQDLVRLNPITLQSEISNLENSKVNLVEQIHNFKEIIEYKEKGECEVIMLIGNHDHHYFPEIGNTGTSGYQMTLAPSIMQVIDENRQHLQMAYQMGEYLFTHAGVSSKFMDNVFGKGEWKTETIAEQLNELFKHKPRTFEFGMAVDMNAGWLLDPTGDNEDQSPIWIRPRSLMRANRNTLRKEVVHYLLYIIAVLKHSELNISLYYLLSFI